MNQSKGTTSTQQTLSPLMRVTTCGEFVLERLVTSSGDESRPVYEPVAPRAWSSRGPAVTLFKVLLCNPRSWTSKDILVEAIWPGEKGETINTERALLAAASVLRGILRSPQGDSLLLTTNGSDGASYRLAAEQDLWVDVDAFETLVQRATRTKDPDDALSWWEAASPMLRGVFLPNDLFSEWSQVRRRQLEGNRRLCLHRLSALYIERRRYAEAEILLRTFWAENPTDEDALRSLMSLLVQQGREEEALLLYEQTELALEDDGLFPTSRTKEFAQRIRQRSYEQTLLLPPRVVAPHTYEVSPAPSSFTTPIRPSASDSSPEQQERDWLAQGASYLGQLFNEGWSLHEVLDSLTIALRTIEVMPSSLRDRLLQTSATMMMRVAPILDEKLLSEEERIKLHRVLSESVIAGW